jgi:hypothetical protein
MRSIFPHYDPDAIVSRTIGLHRFQTSNMSELYSPSIVIDSRLLRVLNGLSGELEDSAGEDIMAKTDQQLASYTVRRKEQRSTIEGMLAINKCL